MAECNCEHEYIAGEVVEKVRVAERPGMVLSIRFDRDEAEELFEWHRPGERTSLLIAEVKQLILEAIRQR